LVFRRRDFGYSRERWSQSVIAGVPVPLPDNFNWPLVLGGAAVVGFLFWLALFIDSRREK
jgi:hypothetical protein